MAAYPKADIVLRNGPVFLGLKEGYASGVALWAGRVLATGSASELEPLIGPGTRVIDLAGRMATPGLYEIRARATDSRGRVQPNRGRNAVHAVSVTVAS